MQRIVHKTVVAHLDKEQPDKALVLSFHGWTGSGKSFVANLIAEHVYAKGLDSNFYRKYIAGVDFPHADKVREYKEKLKKEIIDQTKACQRSMFVFDDIEKMPLGLIDVLEPFINNHHKINGVDFRKNIVIFTSNIGGDEINKETLNHFKAGKRREDIASKRMKEILRRHAFDEGGYTNVIINTKGLVDFFFPFLPMERKHVKQCVRAEIIKRGHKLDTRTEEIVNNVADELEYFPKDSPLYSNNGCKQVNKKLNMFL